MVPQWWNWALTVVGVAGLWLAGSRRAAGWALGIGAQVLWLAYALTTRQYGFLVSAVAYGIVYLRNWRRWRTPADGSASIASTPAAPATASARSSEGSGPR